MESIKCVFAPVTQVGTVYIRMYNKCMVATVQCTLRVARKLIEKFICPAISKWRLGIFRVDVRQRAYFFFFFSFYILLIMYVDLVDSLDYLQSRLFWWQGDSYVGVDRHSCHNKWLTKTLRIRETVIKSNSIISRLRNLQISFSSATWTLANSKSGVGWPLKVGQFLV